jgi:hypothetical protein
MTIDLPLIESAKPVARKTSNSQDHSRPSSNQLELLKHPKRQEKRADHQSDTDKKTPVCCHMPLETAKSDTEDFTTTEDTEFAVNSSTQVAMETKITSKRSKIARVFATMLSAPAILLHSTVDVLRTSPSGISMLTLKSAVNSSSAAAKEIRITSTTRDPARMLACTMA